MLCSSFSPPLSFPNETKRPKKIFLSLARFWAREHRRYFPAFDSTLRASSDRDREPRSENILFFCRFFSENFIKLFPFLFAFLSSVFALVRRSSSRLPSLSRLESFFVSSASFSELGAAPGLRLRCLVASILCFGARLCVSSCPRFSGPPSVFLGPFYLLAD